jgi:hypothetical protein
MQLKLIKKILYFLLFKLFLCTIVLFQDMILYFLVWMVTVIVIQNV